MSRRRRTERWSWVALIALIVFMIMLAVPGFQCVADGGTWVNGVPWPKCLP